MRGRLPSRQPTGLYVHSSPPTGVPVHDSVVRQWLRGGEMSRLKELVLEGEGAALVGEYSPDVTARAFIRALPRILSRIEEAHAAVLEGDLDRAERAVRRERAVRVELSKDQAGLSLLHKAVIRGHRKVLSWILDNFPETVHLTDRERRSALHYAGSSSQPEETWRLLTEAGADTGLTDASGHTPAYYMHHPRRARPPQPKDLRVRPDRGLVVKPANIRIWIHDRDLGRLQKVVWEGFGHKLLSETSSQPKVRRFLSAVPYILGSIRDVHKSSIENDVETLIKRSEDPIPKDILISKDSNGLTPLHKAAGLGNLDAAKEILSRAPEATNIQDALSRTPLHYAAGLRDGQMYQLLVDAGAMEHLQDKKGKTPAYYRSRPGELEAGKMLTSVPEAPRTAHIFPPSWDWRLLHSTSSLRQESTDVISQESPVEETTKVEEINDEELRPEVSEDEGMGSENAQSVDDTASPQNSENLDMEPEEDSQANLNSTITLSRSEFFGEDSGAIDIEAADVMFESPQQIDDEERHEELQEPELKESETEDLPNEAISNGSTNNTDSVTNGSDFGANNETEINSTEEKTDIYTQQEQSMAEMSDELKDDENVEAALPQEEKPEVPSLIRSDTVILEPETAINETQNTLSEEAIGDIQEQDLNELNNIEENKTEPETNESGISENVQDTVDETAEVEISGKKSKESPTNSGRTNKKSSSRRSLKSRALKAIELGRGQVELFEKEAIENSPSVNKETDLLKDDETNSETNIQEDSTETKESANIESYENDKGLESPVDDEQKEETIVKDVSEETSETTNDNDEVEGNQESAHKNVDEYDNEEQEVENETNSTENEIIKDEEEEEQEEDTEGAPLSKTEYNEKDPKETSEEHFPDSLEGSAGGDTAKKGSTRDAPTTEDTEANTDVTDESKDSSLNVREVSSPDSTQKDRRTEAERLVATADMEGMAEMVLSGEGEALLDLKSDNPDVQLFINNVPQYMAKIERVHKASREGDLREVQTSLDRRKFAVARDNGTSLKPTPLHVAVLFGRTSVLRYLAGRFPETMHAQDSGGRTPLHYATTLPDNGHFYSLLITLGADKALPDNNGRTAEYYLRNKDQLTRDMLIAEYQDRPTPIDMSGLNFNRYSDKEWRNGTLTEKKKLTGAEILREGYPIFNPDEGQYLASSLGEPLIKGLTEVAQLRPSNPIIHLANFLLAYEKPEDPGNNDKKIRSIEGTPISHNSHTDENENLDNDETEEEERNEDLGEDDEDIQGIEHGIDGRSERSSPEQEEAFKPVNRDEYGQSMLHFAAARSHGRNAMYQLLQEMDANPGLRDSLYRTARDIAEQTDIEDNLKGIDRYVVSLAARGEQNRLKELLLEGYDHILDAEDGGNILDIAQGRGQELVLKFLKGITQFEENREKLHRAIRFGSLAQVQEIFSNSESKYRLALAKNNYGRCSLHVAVLSQHETTVEYIANKYPDTLHNGDNLMRTPLHYAMALEKVEPLSRILIAAGAQRVLKDLKGRQPSYYFMNKTDIQKLQDEEEALRV